MVVFPCFSNDRRPTPPIFHRVVTWTLESWAQVEKAGFGISSSRSVNSEWVQFSETFVIFLKEIQLEPSSILTHPFPKCDIALCHRDRMWCCALYILLSYFTLIFVGFFRGITSVHDLPCHHSGEFDEPRGGTAGREGRIGIAGGHLARVRKLFVGILRTLVEI